MTARHQIESHKFWDIVALWAKEQLESKEIVARALAKGVIRDGLRLQSTTKQESPALWFSRSEGGA